jgi:putative restriction endonuclease
MSRDVAHGGGSWAFSKCIWAPTHKQNGGTWPFWSKILSVQAGDTVLHLRGIPPSAEFVGYSFASSAGYETPSRPAALGDWHYATAFYRADLDGFTPFDQPINLMQVFSTRQKALESYFDKNRNNRAAKQNIFYVRQNGRLQCLNGAYLSTIDEELFSALFDVPSVTTGFEYKPSVINVSTGQQLARVWTRLGQKKFSEELKRIYGYRCCFPSCWVSDTRFLVASHIARWSDNKGLRGHLGNGLCLCLMHDKAFEIGLFSINEKFEIVASPKLTGNESPFGAELKAATGQKIRLSEVFPLREALSEHWQRVGLSLD